MHILFEKVDFPTPGAMFLGPSLNFRDPWFWITAILGIHITLTMLRWACKGDHVYPMSLSLNTHEWNRHHLRSIYSGQSIRETRSHVFREKTQHKRLTSFVLLLDIELFHIADVVKLSELSLEPLLKHHWELMQEKTHKHKWNDSHHPNIYHYNHKLLYILCFPPITWREKSPLSTPPWPSQGGTIQIQHEPCKLDIESNRCPGGRGVGYAEFFTVGLLKVGKGREVRYDDWEMFSKICIYMI